MTERCKTAIELRDVLNALIDAYCAAGDAAEAVGAVQARLEKDPFPSLPQSFRSDEQNDGYRALAKADNDLNDARRSIAAQQTLLAIYTETHNKLVAAGL